MEELRHKICYFSWDSFTTILALLTLIITFWPKFNSWCNYFILRYKLNKFFHDYQPNSIWHKRNTDLEHLNIADFQNNALEFENRKSVLFYRYQNVIFIKDKDTSLNGILLPSGYHLFKIISDNCIRIDFFNKNDEFKNAYILKENNVPKEWINRNNFEKVISWRFS